MITAAELVAGAFFTAIVLYAVLGGADFGTGFWDLLGGSDSRGAPVRRLIDRSIGPVWEANHVWLIFILVVLWTAFPRVYTALVGALAIPLWLAGLGIVLRGAGFALRKHAPTVRHARAAGITFALSSAITPFFFGSIAGAVASGRVTMDGNTLGIGAALGATPLIGGTLAVLTCAFLAGVFLLADAERTDPPITEQLASKVLQVGVVTGGVALGAVFVLPNDAPTLATGLTTTAAPLVVVSALSGAATLALLIRKNYRLARPAAVIAVGSIVLGWGVAQFPWLLVDQVTIEDGAANPATLRALLVVTAAAVVLVLPSLALLFSLTQRSALPTDLPPDLPTYETDAGEHGNRDGLASEHV